MGPHRVKTNRLAVVVRAAKAILMTILAVVLWAFAVWLAYPVLFPPKPVAAIGLTVCGKVQAVTIIMSDGKIKRYSGPSKEGAALVAKVPAENFADYAVNSAACSPPKVY